MSRASAHLSSGTWSLVFSATCLCVVGRAPAALGVPSLLEDTPQHWPLQDANPPSSSLSSWPQPLSLSSCL